MKELQLENIRLYYNFNNKKFKFQLDANATIAELKKYYEYLAAFQKS